MNPSQQSQESARILKEFEQAWKLGNRPQIADFFSNSKVHDSNKLAEALISIDIRYRRMNSETISTLDYEPWGSVARRFVAKMLGQSTEPMNQEDDTETISLSKYGRQIQGDVKQVNMQPFPLEFEFVRQLGEGKLW